MNATLPKIKLDSQIRLPLNYIKGSEKERFAYSAQLTRDLFQKISELYVINEADSYKIRTTLVPKRIIEEKIQKILPLSLNIKISNLSESDKITPSTRGTVYSETYTDAEGDRIVCEKGVLMPLTKNEGVSADNIWILLHEFTHVMDSLVNPKIEIRSQKTEGKPYPCNLFNNYINTNKETFNFINRIYVNLILNMALTTLSDEQKVDVLQDMRYVIKSEINAYSNTLKYQDEINKKLGINKVLKTDEQRLSEFDFDRKLDLINKKLYRTLTKIRKKHAREIKKEKKNKFTFKV